MKHRVYITLERVTAVTMKVEKPVADWRLSPVIIVRIGRKREPPPTPPALEAAEAMKQRIHAMIVFKFGSMLSHTQEVTRTEMYKNGTFFLCGLNCEQYIDGNCSSCKLILI